MPRPKVKPLHNVLSSTGKGVAMVLLAGVFFTLMGSQVRFLRGTFTPVALTFYRSVFQALVLLPFVWGRLDAGWSFQVEGRAHFLRGSAGLASMYCFYQALQLLPMALASLWTTTSVFWAGMFSWFLLKEKSDSSQWVFATVGVVGLAISLWNPTNSEPGQRAWEISWIGIAFGVLGGVFMGLAQTVLKQMRAKLGSLEIVFFFGIVGALWTLIPFVASPQVPRDMDSIARLIAIGGLATLGQFFLTSGFRYTSTFLGSVTNMQQTLLASLVGFLILSEIPPWTFYLGGFIAVAGFVGFVFQFQTSRNKAQAST